MGNYSISRETKVISIHPERFTITSEELAKILNFPHKRLAQSIAASRKRNSDEFNYLNIWRVPIGKGRNVYRLTRNGVLCVVGPMGGASGPAFFITRKLLKLHRSFEAEFGAGSFYEDASKNRKESFQEIIFKELTAMEKHTGFVRPLEWFL